MEAMTKTADRDLSAALASAAAGDDIAFGGIVAAHQNEMYSICVIVCRDRPMAEEAVQAAWSIAWKKLGSVRQPERLRPWLISVAVNEAKQLLRKRRRRTEVEIAVDASERPGGIDPATGVAGMDLRAAMQRLDPDDRALLTMRYVFGFDATELSTALGISPAATRQRLKRLLDLLRQDLD
jgi:RNA polymerase sigma factor (sigma-70 family)